MIQNLIKKLGKFKIQELSTTVFDPDKTYMIVFPSSVDLEDLHKVGDFFKSAGINILIVQADSVKIIELT